MPYKIMMSVAAVVPLIFLIAFLIVPQFFILQAYPGAEGLGLEIAITQRYIMSGMLYSWLYVLHFNPETLRKWMTKRQFFGCFYRYRCDVCCHNFIGRSRSWSSVARAASDSHRNISYP